MDRSTAVSSRESRISGLAMIARLPMVTNAVSLCVAWIRHQHRLRRGHRRLMALDDHLLADIGLSRDQVERAARSGHLPAWQQAEIDDRNVMHRGPIADDRLSAETKTAFDFYSCLCLYSPCLSRGDELEPSVLGRGPGSLDKPLTERRIQSGLCDPSSRLDRERHKLAGAYRRMGLRMTGMKPVSGRHSLP